MSLKLGTKRGNYKSKKENFSHFCKICFIEYKSADVKGNYCKDCKSPKMCKCGCGKLVKTPGRFFYPGCDKRGKSYLEIHGTNQVTCGFKKGKDNPSKNVDVLRKIWSSVKKKSIEFEGLKFSNNYELNTYKKIREVINFNNIRYENFLYCGDDVFIPDFMVYTNDGTLSSINEVSGFASFNKEGRDRNILKLNKIKMSYPNIIVNFIAPKKLLADYIEQLKDKQINFIEYEKFLKNEETAHY